MPHKLYHIYFKKIMYAFFVAKLCGRRYPSIPSAGGPGVESGVRGRGPKDLVGCDVGCDKDTEIL